MCADSIARKPPRAPASGTRFLIVTMLMALRPERRFYLDEAGGGLVFQSKLLGGVWKTIRRRGAWQKLLRFAEAIARRALRPTSSLMAPRDS